MLIALAIPRAAWIDALHHLWRSLLAPLAAGKYFGLRRLDAAVVARETAAASIAPIFSNMRAAVSAPAAGAPTNSNVGGAVSAAADGDPIPPSPTELPFPHSPNATAEQALRQADALWQTLQNALIQHIQDNLSSPAPEDTFHTLGIAPGTLLPIPPGAPAPAPSPKSEIYLIAHNPRHLNILTLVLKRIQNNRLSIIKTLNHGAPITDPDPQNDPLLRQVNLAISNIKAHQAARASNPPAAPAPTGLASAEAEARRTDKRPVAAPTGLAPVERRTDKLPAAPYAPAPTGLAPVERRTDKLPATPYAADAAYDEEEDFDNELDDEQDLLDTLLDIIRTHTLDVADSNATLITIIRQCDALWQILQTAITPLAPLVATPHDLNNLTTALWRITTSRHQALTLLPPSPSS